LLVTLFLAALVASDATPSPAQSKLDSTKVDLGAAPAPATTPTSPTTKTPAKDVTVPSAPAPAKTPTPAKTPASTTTPSASGTVLSQPVALAKGPVHVLSSLLSSRHIPFEANHSPVYYLQQTLDFNSVKGLYGQLQKTVLDLQTRQEAHITVINPQEYGDVLSKAGVTMDEIDNIAKRHRIQNASFKVLCMGKAHVPVNGKPDTVFFLVVSAPSLVKIRKDVERLYVKKGGEPSLFEAEAFWPHITVGFTIRDVFLLPDDHVYKGTNTCIRPVKFISPRKPHRGNKGHKGKRHVVKHNNKHGGHRRH